MGTPTPTAVFDTYWRFAAARQDLFFARIESPGEERWTDDAILSRHKFTNAYRAADRVSQYLIRDVVYAGPQDPADVFLRTLLFKIFNRIETWELLTDAIGEIAARSFDFEACDQMLSGAMQRGLKIFSAAYIMPASPDQPRKHTGYLALLHRMMDDGLPGRLAQSAQSLEEVYRMLRSYPLMGEFLAFQYTIDLNYGPLLDFDEDDFVVAGPGAISGISKCFSDTGGMSAAEIIRWVTDNQEREFDRLGLRFRNLFGRRLRQIDCQNLFCEVNKYARIAHPDIAGADGRTNIKEVFVASDRPPVQYWFPPKWGINGNIPPLPTASPVRVNQQITMF